MLQKILSILIAHGPANFIHAVLLRLPKTKLYGTAISTKELKAVRSTATEILSRTEIESLLRALQAAGSGVPEPLLSQAGAIARLFQAEIRRWPMICAKLLHTVFLREPKTKPYAEVVSTEKLCVVLSTVAETLSDAELESLVRATLLHTDNSAQADATVS